MAPSNNDNNEDENSRNPLSALRHFIDSEIVSVVSAAESIRPHIFNLRPHIEKSLEDLERDHHAAWKRFIENYERSTSPERKSIEPMTGTQAAADRERREKARREEEGNALWSGWGWGWGDEDRRLGKIVEETKRESQRLAQAKEGSSYDTAPWTWFTNAKNNSNGQAREVNEEAQRPEPHPFDAFFNREPQYLLDALTHNIWHGTSAPYWSPFSPPVWEPSERYLYQSPYSPLRLEDEGSTAQKGEHWRCAFQDLLYRTNPEIGAKKRGMRGMEREDWVESMKWCGVVASPGFTQSAAEEVECADRSAPGLDERATQASSSLGMTEDATPRPRDLEKSAADHVGVARGLPFDNKDFEDLSAYVGSLLMGKDPYPAAHQDHHSKEEAGQARVVSKGVNKDAQGGEESELQVYEHFLAQDQHRGSKQQQQQQNQPSIISTLTTTERSILPDGTVTTKAVLKKRFADGTESCEETEDVQRGTPRPAVRTMEKQRRPKRRPALKAGEKKESKNVKEEKKSWNWFWSSE